MYRKNQYFNIDPPTTKKHQRNFQNSFKREFSNTSKAVWDYLTTLRPKAKDTSKAQTLANQRVGPDKIKERNLTKIRLILLLTTERPCCDYQSPITETCSGNSMSRAHVFQFSQLVALWFTIPSCILLQICKGNDADNTIHTDAFILFYYFSVVGKML